MMLVMYVIMKCHPVRGCIKVGNFILLHYHWMKSIAKQSTNKHYSTMQRTKEYMFVVNLEFLCLFSMIVIVCVPSKIHLKLENRWWNTITSFDIQMSAEKEPLTRFIFFIFALEEL